jgi:hypothetical protein
VKQPVFSFEAEILTDAPYALVAERLRNPGPAGFRSLRGLATWQTPEEGQGFLVLHWARTVGGAEESGALTLFPDPKGARLRLEGRMKGWAGFVFFGLLRWKTDRLLDRLVEEL